MLWYILFFNAFSVILARKWKAVNPGPSYVPTKGYVWPKPHTQAKLSAYYKLTPSITFTIAENGKSCDILHNAIERSMNVLKKTHFIAYKHSKKLSKYFNRTYDNPDANYKGPLMELQINLNKPCEKIPHLHMDEKYCLEVSEISTLNSKSIWGILRGLETFVQLFYMSNDYKNIYINATKINDFPKYTHRGLQIDTSAHYLSVSSILKILDGMEMNKMNVLHWHIVDDQSFPYQSDVLPMLRNAAFDPALVYTATDIIHIVDYAKDRGIRVVPEFDLPGHTKSWGLVYPDILTKCYDFGENAKESGLGPMELTNDQTYQLISDLFHEVQGLFPDEYFHIGGDEIDVECWRSNPQIKKFMVAHNITLDKDLISFFMNKTFPLLNDRSPIVSQEVFDAAVPLPNGTVIQVTKSSSATKMFDIISSDYKIIYSTPWLLDNNSNQWQKFYGSDPRKIVFEANSNVNLKNVLGGEVYMRGSLVDDSNVLTRIWPRASAVAEVLWSGGPTRNHVHYFGAQMEYKIKCRLEEQVCRMNRRGIPVPPPNGPGFCIVENK